MFPYFICRVSHCIYGVQFIPVGTYQYEHVWTGTYKYQCHDLCLLSQAREEKEGVGTAYLVPVNHARTPLFSYPIC